MTRLGMMAGGLLLAACATQAPAPPGKQVDAGQLESRIVPGTTTRAQLLDWFGPTTHVRFDSGYESWLYQTPAGTGLFSEYVVLINPQGVVRKTRRRAPDPPAPADRR
jgi:hypothetical protein